MEIYYILDASAFINGFELESKYNFTVPEIINELKDFKSKLVFENSIKENKLNIVDVDKEYIKKINKVISESGDSLRLSNEDTRLIALAMMLKDQNKNIIVVSDDYSIQNVLKLLNIKYQSILTEGIKGIYNWKKVCEGCKKEFSDDYPYDDCEICGSKIFKKRIKL